MSDRKRRIVLSFTTRDNDYQRLQAQDAQTVATREGFDAEVQFANNSAIEQVQQLFKFVHRPPEERPYAIVLQAVSGEGLERVARNATQNGIGWILVNNPAAYLDELRQQHPELPIASVGTDQLAVGRLQGQQLCALLPRGGQVLYVTGPSDTAAAQDRLKAAREVAEVAGISFVVLEGRWTSESAERALLSWLRLRTGAKIDLIASQNDSMAEGARRAVLGPAGEAVRREAPQLPFTGCDGLPEGGRRMVDKGELAATIVLRANGGPAVELLAQFGKGKPIPARTMQQPVSYPSEDDLRRRLAQRPR